MDTVLVVLGAGLGIIILLSLNEAISKACDEKTQIERPRVIRRISRRYKKARMRAQQ